MDPKHEQPQHSPDQAPANATPHDADHPVADDLLAELDRLRAERDDLNAKFLRTLADYQNFQRRSTQNEAAARQHGSARVVERLVGALDHFDLALAQDHAAASAEQILTGVRLIREEFTKALQSVGVVILLPAPNDEFTPGKHEAVMQQPADAVEPGRVVRCFQPGYIISGPAGEHVIRPAKVVVSPAG